MSATRILARPAEVPRDRFEQEVLQHQGQVLVELWKPGKNTEFFTEALMEQAQRHPEVKVVRINVDEYRDLIEEYHRRRAINQTYDLAHVPGVALFRNGKLITTMKPLIVNSEPALIAYNVRRQLDVFLAKFVEDVKTSVPSDESDAPGGAGEGGAPADDKEAKIKAALEKAAKLKAERAKQKAAQGAGKEAAPAAGARAAAKPAATAGDAAAAGARTAAKAGAGAKAQTGDGATPAAGAKATVQGEPKTEGKSRPPAAGGAAATGPEVGNPPAAGEDSGAGKDEAGRGDNPGATSQDG
mgnify:CR=1 FL=1